MKRLLRPMAMVDVNDLLRMISAVNAVVVAAERTGVYKALPHRLVENFINKRALTGAECAGHGGESGSRERDVNHLHRFSVDAGTKDGHHVAGDELWRPGGMSAMPIPSPFAHEGLLYINGGTNKPIAAIKPGTSGDLTTADGAASLNEFVAWLVPAAIHVFTHARFTDLNAEFEQFAVNPRSSPDRIFVTHGSN